MRVIIRERKRHFRGQTIDNSLTIGKSSLACDFNTFWTHCSTAASVRSWRSKRCRMILRANCRNITSSLKNCPKIVSTRYSYRYSFSDWLLTARNFIRMFGMYSRKNLRTVGTERERQRRVRLLLKVHLQILFNNHIKIHKTTTMLINGRGNCEWWTYYFILRHQTGPDDRLGWWHSEIIKSYEITHDNHWSSGGDPRNNNKLIQDEQ